MYALSVSPVFRRTLPSMVQTRHASGVLSIMEFFGLGDLVDSFLSQNGVIILEICFHWIPSVTRTLSG
jgi:hypothetical protein